MSSRSESLYYTGVLILVEESVFAAGGILESRHRCYRSAIFEFKIHQKSVITFHFVYSSQAPVMTICLSYLPSLFAEQGCLCRRLHAIMVPPCLIPASPLPTPP
jgi:hypothetical protein